MAQTKKLVRHPGEIIREELEARGWMQRDLAFVLGIPEQAVNMIISGKRGISPEMAKQLGEAFDVLAEFFMNLQRTYDLSKAPQIPLVLDFTNDVNELQSKRRERLCGL